MALAFRRQALLMAGIKARVLATLAERGGKFPLVISKSSRENAAFKQSTHG
jgi:hypothetical protein